MGGVALAGKRVSYDEGNRVAQEALLRLKGAFDQAIVCGSIRRNRPTVGDVDLVVLGNDKLDETLIKLCGVQKNGKPARKFLLDGVQVDIYPATIEDFGAQMLMWTGSKLFNIRCRKAAQERGFLMNQYGVWKNDQRLFGATEESVLTGLGMKWIPPEERE